MRKAVALALILTGLLPALAQEETWMVDDLLDAGEAFLEENLDPSLLEALPELDPEVVGPVLREIQTRLAGEYVLDLAGLKGAADQVLTFLEGSPQTQPWASWLRTRVDYFAVVDELSLLVIPPPTDARTAQASTAPPVPSPPQQRAAWQKSLHQRPIPRGANAYVSRLKPIFASQRLPTELVWLAEVESSFDPLALSPSGAVGLYQLMPRTAELLGLSLAPTDERADPEKNARAAARHLRSLYAEFGDWPLAMAAYNAGGGRVGGLLRKHGAQSFDGIARHLPAETQLYVPKVEATLQRREGAALSRLPAPSPAR